MDFAQETDDNFIDIPDSFPGYEVSHFCIPGHYVDSVSGVLIPHGMIQERVRKMAKDILKDILDETTVTEEPTANICLDAESLTLTREQEMITIMDLLSDEKDTFDDLINISSETVMTETELNVPFYRTPVIAKTFSVSGNLHPQPNYLPILAMTQDQRMRICHRPQPFHPLLTSDHSPSNLSRRSQYIFSVSSKQSLPTSRC